MAERDINDPVEGGKYTGRDFILFVADRFREKPACCYRVSVGYPTRSRVSFWIFARDTRVKNAAPRNVSTRVRASRFTFDTSR